MSGETTKIKTTTIERGVRVVNSNGASGDDYSVAPVKALAVAAIKLKRDQEKQELVRLNERFAAYIERVKFLEGQNKKLLADLDDLRQKWGDESKQIKERFEPELLDARGKIDDITRDKAKAEIRAKRSEYEATNFKRQYDEAVHLISSDKNKINNLEYILQENNAELELLKRQMSDSENDIEKYRKEISHLNNDLQNLLDELDQVTLHRVRLENEKQTLEEQIPFLNAVHEQEIAELKTLQAGANIDPTHFYRHELERAIRDIRGDFEQLNETQKRELEEWYKIKTEEIQQQVAKRDALDSSISIKSDSAQQLKGAFNDSQKEMNDLKQHNSSLILRLNQLEEDLEHLRRNNGLVLDDKDREINDIRSKLQDLIGDYDQLMNNKTSLEFEINTYRRLLESEEHRTVRKVPEYARYQPPQLVPTHQVPVQQIPVQIPVVTEVQTSDVRLSTSEMSAKTTFQRSAKGPVSISECSPDGKVIILENTSRNKDISMTNWVLKRRVDNKPEITYKFPENLTLKANKVVRIWARGHGKENLPTDLVNKDIENWGMGVNIVTIVLNDLGDEKATHLQKTVYAS